MEEDLRTMIRVKLAELNKSQGWLARQLGITDAYMSDIVNGKRSGKDQIVKIKAALKI